MSSSTKDLPLWEKLGKAPRTPGEVRLKTWQGFPVVFNVKWSVAFQMLLAHCYQNHLHNGCDIVALKEANRVVEELRSQK